MIQYEETLNKISPIFYKFIKYHDFTTEQEDLITSYLIYVEIPTEYDLTYVPLSNTYYYSSYRSTPVRYGLGVGYIKLRVGYKNIERIILKKKKSEIETHDISTIDEQIVNLIINRLSYENEYIEAKLGLSYKKYVMALIGRDTYEAIRRNIK